MNDSVENAVIAALAEMGVCPTPGTLLRTFALSEGRRCSEVLLRRRLRRLGSGRWNN